MLSAHFGPYLSQSLKLALLALLFYFHEGVQEAACRCVRVFSLFGDGLWGLLTDLLYLSIPRYVLLSFPYRCAFVVALQQLFPLFLRHTMYMDCA